MVRIPSGTTQDSLPGISAWSARVKRKEPASFQALVMPLFRERKREAHLTLNTVKSRYRRALVALRKQLGE